MEAYESQLDIIKLEKLIPEQIVQTRKLVLENYQIDIPKDKDKFIARCLRHKDGNLEKTAELIKVFYGVVADLKKWEISLKPSIYREYYKNGGITPLKHRDEYGRRIFVARIKKWIPDLMSFDELIAAIWMTGQWANAESWQDQRYGFVAIWDVSGFTMQQAWAVKHRRLLSFAGWTQSGVGGRPMLTEKIRRRVHFHGEVNCLHEYLDPAILPTLLGGEISWEDCVDWEFLKKLNGSDQFFEDMLQSRWPRK